MEKKLKVLAVGDPAVYAYTDTKFAIIEQFNKQHNAAVVFDIIPFDEYYPLMMKSLQGKSDYDIVMVAGHLWVKDFITKGYLAEISIPASEEYDYKDILDVVREEMSVNSTPYLYPSFCDGHILLYRKSIVEKMMQRPIPEVISTDDILTIASKCHGVEGKTGIALKAHPNEILLDFLPYLRNEGTDAFDQDNHAPSFNNEYGRSALAKYISLKEYAPKDTHLYGNDEIREAFQNKKSILAVTWGGQLGMVLDERCQERDDIGFAAVKTAWNVTWSFAINRTSPNQVFANEFLAFLTSKKIDRIVGSYAGSPVRKSTYLADTNKYDWYATHLQLISEQAKPLPSMDHAGEKMAPLYENIYQAFIGKQSVAEALEEAEEKVWQINQS